MTVARSRLVLAVVAAGAWAAPAAGAAEPVRFEVLDEDYETVGSDELEVRVRAANTDQELLELWHEFELGTTPPPVDLARWLVVGFNSGTLPGCASFGLDGVDRDGTKVTVRGSTVPAPPGTTCGGVSTEARLALTLERADLPPGPGTVTYERDRVPLASTEAHLGGTATAQPRPETTTTLPDTGGAAWPLAATGAATLASAGVVLLLRRRPRAPTGSSP